MIHHGNMRILEMNGYEKYVDDLDIGASARKKKLESRSLNSSTERRVGWASDPTSPPTRDLSIGGATLQMLIALQGKKKSTLVVKLSL